MEWSEFIVSILAGLAAAIPLVVKLVEYVQKAVKEKKLGKDAGTRYGPDGGRRNQV